MTETKIVLFIFAGRKANMEVQKPYLDRLLEEWPQLEIHLWNLTRTSEDHAYLMSRDSERTKVMNHLHPGHPIRCLYPNGRPQRMKGHPPCRCMRHKPPFEKPYQWYARHEEYADAFFVKVDDDVVFLETDRLADLLNPLILHPEHVYSANVVNNAVCAKYDIFLQDSLQWLGNPAQPENDYRWWQLHESALFARLCHLWFLDMWKGLIGDAILGNAPIRTREGEAISINCIAFTHKVMRSLALSFGDNPRLGDEGAVDAMLPWIVPTFRAAHLTFGPQEATMPPAELDDLRARYAEVAKEYLS